MLPFRRPDRVVALDDTDIVECHDLDARDCVDIEHDVEMELDLGDAVEVQVASRLPAVRTPPERRPSGTLQIPGFLQPQTRVYQFGQLDEPEHRPLTLKTPTQGIRPAVIANQLPETVARPPHSAQMRAGVATMGSALDDDEEDEELTELKEPLSRGSIRTSSSWNSQRARSASQITPSPFARTFSQQDWLQDPTQARPESIAPVAVHVTHAANAGDRNTPRLRLERVEREESALEQRELQAITSTPSTKILRGVALMLMGGVAAAAITMYALRNDGPAAGLEASPLPPMASITVPKDAVLIGNTPPQQVETRPGAQPPPGAEPAAVAVPVLAAPPAPALKFGDGDALLVTTPSPAPQSSAGPAVAAGSGSHAGASAHANAGGAQKPRKPSQPLPPNALLPDSDSPPSYSLPPSRGGAPKDPVAEAQLRASMR